MSTKINKSARAHWYNEEQWNILKELEPDALDDNYEIWHEPTAPYRR